MDYIVEYDYVAQNDDELTIKKGDKIKNAYKKEEGWMEGELNGRKGLFPDNFVKPHKKSMTTPNNSTNNNSNTQIIKDNNTVEKKKGFFNLGSKFINPDKRPSNKNNNVEQTPQVNGSTNGGTSPIQASTSPTPPASHFKPSKPYETFKAKVIYTYQPQNEDEIAIQEGQIVDVIRLVEEGWFEGTFNGKRGVFPSNYVIKIENNSNNNSVDSNTQKSVDKTANSSDELDLNDSSDNKKLNSSGGVNGKKPIGGVGFGNIFSGKPIELKTTNNKETKQLPVPPPPPTTTSSSTSSSSSSNSTIVSKARVLFNYVAKQPDELTLTTGDIINILDKHLDDEGWWKGELNGHVGVFPDNFVEEIQQNTDQHATKHHPIMQQQPQLQPQQQHSPVLSLSQQKKFNNHLANNNNSINPTNITTPIIPNSTNNNNTNGPYINLFNTNNGNHNANNNHILSSSASSSSSSLIVNNEKDNKSQLTDKDEPKSTNQQDNQQDPTSVDESMKIDDLQSENRLTHMRKPAKQINKRPPSFRYKTRGEKIEDAESLMPVTSITPTPASSTGTTSNEHIEQHPEVATRTKSPSLKELKKKSLENDSNNNNSAIGAAAVVAPVAMSPSPPPYTSTIGGQNNHNIHNNHQHQTSNNNNNNEEVQHLKSELELLKRAITQITTDHKNEMQKLHNETRNQKVLYDDQINKLQKKLKELIDEIDDEKKTRLALQVELERIKKTISSN